MNPQTQFLLDTLTKNLIIRVMEEYNYPLLDAMRKVYNSSTYKKITDLETGLYYQSAGYNFEMLQKELGLSK